MSTNKRRQVIKSTKQTEIQFPHTKASFDPYGQRKEFTKKMEAQSYNYDAQSGAKDSCTPFRSVNRINNLLKASPYFAQHGHAKLVEHSKISPPMYQLYDISKPSSATTACTWAASEYSAIKGDLSSLAKTKREQKSDRKNNKDKRLAGSKRPAQMKLDQMEYFLRLQSSSAKFVARNLKLRDKKTGQVVEFSLLNEEDIKGFKNNSIVTGFDMSKLEVEYDYDTDFEQAKQSKNMLLSELFQAIDFFIKDDPLKLVDNLAL